MKILVKALVEQRIAVVVGEPLRGDYENFVVWRLPTVRKNGREYAEIMKISDTHYGHKVMLRSFLQRHLKLAKKNPHMRIQILGDLFEMQNLSDFLREAETPEKNNSKCSSTISNK